MWWQIRDYVRSFADAFGLADHVELGAEVRRAEPVHDKDGEWWRVTLASGEQRAYRGVVWACGAQWFPCMPQLPGVEDFRGEVIHSSRYSRVEQLTGRRVLVIGAGNSGVDIVCDAATHADRAWLSMRRGYWFLPKQVFGVPIPDLLSGAVAPPRDPALPQGLTPEQLLGLVLAVVGDLRLYGLPAPDHQIGATHPIVNDQVLHHLSHGRLQARPDVERLTATGVQFVDRTAIECDLVVCATGYDVRTPWLDPSLLEWYSGHPRFHLGTFAPGVPGLYAVGLLRFSDNPYPLFDQLAQLVAADAHATLTGENRENMQRLKEEFHPDLKGGYPFVQTRRNELEVHPPALREAIDVARDRYGVAVPSVDDDEFYESLRRRATIGASSA